MCSFTINFLLFFRAHSCMKLHFQNQFISFLHETVFVFFIWNWNGNKRKVRINALPLLMTLSHVFKFYIKFMSFVYMPQPLMPTYSTYRRWFLSWIFQKPKITFRYLSFIFHSSFLFQAFILSSLLIWWMWFIKKIVKFYSTCTDSSSYESKKKKKIKCHCLSRGLDNATRWRLRALT